MENNPNPESAQIAVFQSWCVVVGACNRKYVRYDASKMPSEKAVHAYERYRDSFNYQQRDSLNYGEGRPGTVKWAEIFESETGYSSKEFSDFMFTWQQELRK
ncbi:hypothetical protein JKY72_02120 [Candidatus Gracilibacteria bacterium]|nr:hypothetical protein [Candidatus Gracilibacteria bacterium]